MNINKSNRKILFIYLSAFSNTGGIEKVNRTILKSLSFHEGKKYIESWSLNDWKSNKEYFSNINFKGFAKSKIKFVLELLYFNRKWDEIIVGHVNLAIVVRIMKLLNPRLKIILIVHGIEVWDSLTSSKLWLLHNADKIISVSKFTSDRIIEKFKVLDSKISIVHNCLDPFFPKKLLNDKPAYLLERYQLTLETKVILTITRINEKENRKGYDQVLKSLSAIVKNNSEINFHYLLCGKYSIEEFNRLTNLINEFKLTNRVSITGFIKEDELVDHYRLSDIYIMPSKKEGFGMVYIEAAACGLQVIAGNTDGSAEALMNGKIGHLINPDNDEEIYNKLLSLLQKPSSKSTEISKITYEHFNFDRYRKKLISIIESV